jgi:glutathione S-transferase
MIAQRRFEGAAAGGTVAGPKASEDPAVRLRYSALSPYVRKVVVTAEEAGLAERIQRIETDVWAPDSDVVADNPLGKVPALALDDGTVLYDSPLICEYLAGLAPQAGLLPVAGPERLAVQNLAALADGVMDAGVARTIEIHRRPLALRWNGWLERQKAKCDRALDLLERRAAAGAFASGAVDLGTIALGCALGYLDFRFPGDHWRDGRPALTDWYAGFAERPSMRASVPA